MTTQKVLLSTDIGSDIDDALALMVMLRAGINLKGVYTVNGRVDFRSYIAKHMIDLSGKSGIVVANGESKAFDDTIIPFSYYEEMYVDDSFIDQEKSDGSKDVVYKQPERVGIIPNGLDDLAERLSQDKYVLFSIGPMTNIARVILCRPETSKNIEHIYVMGCHFSDDSKFEHNIVHDPDAAKIVFNSKIPITVIPLEVCERYQAPVDMFKEMDMFKGMNDALGKYVEKMVMGFVGIKTALCFEDFSKLGEMLKKYFGRIGGEETEKSILSNSLTIQKFLDDFVRIPNENEKSNYDDNNDNKKLLPRIERFEASHRKDILLVNMNDPIHAAYGPSQYFEQYYELIEQLSDKRIGFKYADIAVYILKNIVPTHISIADVYTPYCFLHPEKLKIEKKRVRITDKGESFLEESTENTGSTKGIVHNVVREIDYKHFEEFVRRYSQGSLTQTT